MGARKKKVPVGQTLQEARKSREWSQRAAASDLPVHYTTYSRWEREGAVPEEHIDEVAELYGLDPDELRDEADDDPAGFVETEQGTADWRNRVALDQSLSDPVKLALLALPIWWDEWARACVVGRSNLHDEIGIPADQLDEVIETLAETDYVERVGAEDVEWVFRLREVGADDD